MITDVKLTAEEFKSVHNGMCELRYQIENLLPFINEKLAQSLSKGLKSIETGLAGAYQKDEDEFDRRSAHYDEVCNKHNFKSIWSMHEVEDLNADHIYPNATHVMYDAGGATNSVPINGKTWVSLWRAADTLIKISGDNHHIFVEDFIQIQGVDTILQLSTGS